MPQVVFEHGLVLSANEATPTKFQFLSAGLHKVDVIYPATATGTLTPKQTLDISNTASYDTVDDNDGAISITETDSFVITGPCYLGFIVASLANGPIEVHINKTRA